jgi:hypothetical protein
VPCPLFIPTERLESGRWHEGPRWPLGDAWNGRCAAAPDDAIEESALLECCNAGYARQRCARVPAESADAVRFTMLAGGAVHWAEERDHLPVRHGLVAPGHDGPLERQAAAFHASWNRRRRTRSANA